MRNRKKLGACQRNYNNNKIKSKEIISMDKVKRDLLFDGINRIIETSNPNLEYVAINASDDIKAVQIPISAGV